MNAPVKGPQSEKQIGRFSLRSFRAKFILVVGVAVLFDLALAGGIGIWNVQKLSRDATEQVGEGLTTATEDYLETYIDTTAFRADLLIERVHSELATLASSMQTLIDHPDIQEAVGNTIEDSSEFSSGLVYDEKGGWSQNTEGVPSAVSVWGYLLDEDKNPLPKAADELKHSSFLSLVGPSMMSTGAPKLQIYYVGPKDASIMRATPYSEQAQTFDLLYPGHNEGANFWDFFFPGVYEGWQGWIKDPSSKPVESNIVTTAPYIDAITGKLIVSFFHPLWTQDRKDVAGMVAVDITLEQLTSLVESLEISESGFGFLTMSDGNVVATPKAGEATLGLVSSDVSGQGVTGVNRNLKESSQPAISSLELSAKDETVIKHIFLENDGEEVPYLLVLKQLNPTNLWDGTGITSETMTLGFVVSEREIYQSLIDATNNISEATARILNYQLIAFCVSIFVVFVAVYAISGRITKGLSQLAAAARALQNKDYSVRVAIPTRDEVAAVGLAFNRMAEEISYHTENLENLVEERTRKLETANHEIGELNKRLKSENLRLGAELDVAKRIQEMVLPRLSELEVIPQIEIAAFMEPADEVGGDYYDVLFDGSRIKVGIGDVTGHGLESGVLMLMVQSVARALQEKGDKDPIAFLDVLNRAVYKNITRTNSDKHLTLAFVDYEDGQVTLSGQHEEVLIIRANGETERIDTMDLGFPVGLEADISPFVATLDLAFGPDDILILHTDGITEAENAKGEMYGLDRLAQSAHENREKSAKGIAAAVINDVKSHIGDYRVFDDITLVVLKHR
ncbi:Phosphoserine phosphatase RsbU [Labrenzia sp. THAF191b]|uniref:SpoIIE family protein phosphatase n=1 Tax=unclassified Labrenzia TaxID=2648686 RepID=UPI001267F9E9|nr:MULTISPECIES: SpoIIE family protein phosphatase [unclassified Labrenzia]QFS96673.1 Phosphoserine phosphatase RsbU [Labrenzia sp. THAF191b]QFT02988.1 Phosphoserine phosphatase RsbU [Labrenzia sp. THAF191a]QFT14530.1 Phosphoserine phosphatase RsbU [Labrenzia sp. THAF187b]